MNKAIIKMTLAVMITGLLASSVYAAPVQLNDAQLDVVAAGGVEKVDGFVCPVIKTDAVLNSPRGIMIGEGHYSILGPNVSVPKHATNTNNDGTRGTPPGPHAAPGDKGYTAIWDISPTI